jgi:hypothetical protein
MISETAVPHRGGVLHLNRPITADQKATLQSLPPPKPEKQAMIDAHMAYATAFLPRARRLAIDWGVDWPDRLEDVTWDNLKITLGLKKPY